MNVVNFCLPFNLTRAAEKEMKWKRRKIRGLFISRNIWGGGKMCRKY